MTLISEIVGVSASISDTDLGEKETALGVSEKFTWDQVKAYALAGLKQTGGTIIVDDVFGDDGTGIPYSTQFPFKTGAGAQSVVTAGDCILFKPSPNNYSSASLGVDGVRYHYEHGANTVTSGNCFNDFGNGSFSVTGFGRFNSNAAAVFFSSGVGTFFFQAMYAEGGGASSRTLWTTGNSILVAEIETDLVLSGLEQVIRTNGASGQVFVTCNRMIGAGGLVQCDNGKVIAYAKEFIYNAAGAGYVGVSAAIGTVELNGKCYFNNAGIYGLPSIYNTGSGTIRINGTVFNTNTDGIATISGTTTLEFNDHIYASGKIVNSGGIIKINKGMFGAEADAITHNSGTTVLSGAFELNGATAILVAGAGLLIKQDAVIYIGGASESVYSATGAKTITTYPGAVSNLAPSVDITEDVSSMLISASVIPY